MCQIILEKLYEGKKISFQQSYKLFNYIIEDKISNEQISAILIGMKIRGEHHEEIAGAVTAMFKTMKYFPSPNYLFADIVGTGGDYKNSINISTISAIVAAGCGIHVAKHNNRSISSMSGSSDILELFGVNLNISAKSSRRLLDTLGICFLFAPKYNNGFNNRILKIRKLLKTRTLFNILGPLLNPAKPPLILIGVYSPNLLLPIAKTLKILKYKKALVIHSGGMDEVTLYANTNIAELNNNKIKMHTLNAEDFGLKYQTQKSLIIKNTEENYELLCNLLQGRGSLSHESVIAANVALLLKLFGHENLYKNTSLALEQIKSGNSYKRIMSFIKNS